MKTKYKSVFQDVSRVLRAGVKRADAGDDNASDDAIEHLRKASELAAAAGRLERRNIVFERHAMTNGVRIAFELVDVESLPFDLIEAVEEAARALAVVEASSAFSWENQNVDWETACGELAAKAKDGTHRTPNDWANVVQSIVYNASRETVPNY